MNEEINIYLQFIKKYCPEISNEELNQFSNFLYIKKFNKKEYIFKSGLVQSEMGFITKGLVRSFFIDERENDKTLRFLKENNFATHYVAFITQTKSPYSLICLEPTTIVAITYKSLQMAYQNLPSIQKFGRLMAEEILKLHQNRIESFLFESAEERYVAFTTTHQDLFNKISLTHLSSYLGIERQTITRIRQKLAKK